MNAEIVAVGSELLTPQRLDTNSLWLTERLNSLGVEVVTKIIVGDDRSRLSATLATALRRSQVVVVTGGLGPTEDDVTRDAVAQTLGRQLVFRQDLCDAIAERFARMNRPMADINKRQAFIVEGAEPLPNTRGTAPGLWLTPQAGTALMLLPGPPQELKPMFTGYCEPRLRGLLPPLCIATVWFRVAGMGESDLDALIAPVYTKYANPVTTILAAPGDVQVHLRARCSSDVEAQALVAELGGKIEELLGARIYSRNGDTLEAAVGSLLRERGATIAVAESCTGGMVAERLTSIAGASTYFRGGFVTYQDDVKVSLLGVDPALILRHTEVSDEVAVAMAEGARLRASAAYALSVTGYAGPAGGTADNPVGTVYIGLADAQSSKARRFQFSALGGRERIRSLAATTALDWLRRRLLNSAES
jgi:nicotinamide-nucleotide amidase